MDLGDTLRFKSDVTDGSGALVNATSVSLTIMLPDGTTATPTVTNPPAVTGKYFCDYVTSVSGPAGRYVGQWLFTFSGGATTSYVETFEVGGSLVTVDEALAHLRATGTITTTPDLDELQWLCIVASEAVELDLNRALTIRTVTEAHDGGRFAVVLRSSPVIDITSVTESGTAITDYVLNANAGIVQPGSTWSRRRFIWGMQNIVVTYRAGYLNPPRVITKVALNAIQEMWQQSQGGGPPQLPGDLVYEARGMLTPLEQAAYDTLRTVGIA